MNRILRVVSVGVLAALVARTSVCAQQDETEEAKHVARLAAELQKKVAQLPVAAVNTAPDAVKFAALALDQTQTVVDGRNYYAFRFTSPAIQGDLIWSFKLPPGMKGWFICPAVGKMQGFSNYNNRRLLQDVEGLGKKGERFVVQTLDGSHLLADAEYIMWFEFAPERAAAVTFSLNVLAGEAISLSQLFPYLWQQPERASAAGG